MRRSEVIQGLMMEGGMASTPAYKRIAGLVRRGLLVQGTLEQNPYRQPKDVAGAYLWLPAAGVSRPPGRPVLLDEEQFLGAVAAAGNTPRSIRALTRAVSEHQEISAASVHRLVKRLVLSGHMASSKHGYTLTPTGEEVAAGWGRRAEGEVVRVRAKPHPLIILHGGAEDPTDCILLLHEFLKAGARPQAEVAAAIATGWGKILYQAGEIITALGKFEYLVATSEGLVIGDAGAKFIGSIKPQFLPEAWVNRSKPAAAVDLS